MRWHQAGPHVVLPGHGSPRTRPIEARAFHRGACPGGHRATGPEAPETAAVHHGVHGAKTPGEGPGSLGVVPVRQARLVLFNSKTNVIAPTVCVISPRLVAHLSAT
jgi:hypothetical protein